MVTTYSFKNKTVDCYVFENNGWCDSYLIEAYFSDNVRLTDAECAEFFAEFREEILEAELVPYYLRGEANTPPTLPHSPPTFYL